MGARAFRAGLSLALSLASGCVIDWEQYRLPVRVDAASDLAPVDTASDVVTEAVAEAATDAGCARSESAQVRVAHMATGFEPLDLCVRRTPLVGSRPFEKVSRDLWPAAGVGYTQVSRYVPVVLDAARTDAGLSDSWDFAVVPHDGSCAEQLATVTGVGLRPGVVASLLFLAAPAPLSRMNATMFLLEDEACAACAQAPFAQHDLRAVHAVLGAADLRLDLALTVGSLGTTLARNIPYGNSGSSQLDDDYHCTFLRARGTAFSARINGSGGEELLASDPVALPSEASGYRLATLFLYGVPGSESSPPGFTLCFDGARTDGGFTLCEPLGATSRYDAGRDTSVDAVVDSAGDLGPEDAPVEDLPVQGNDSGVDPSLDASDDAEPTALSP